MRLGILWTMLAGVVLAQPMLPVVAEQNFRIASWRIHEASTIYDTWKATRKVVAKLAPETSVESLGRINVVYQPDVIRVTRDYPQERLKSGDVVLRYADWGEGFGDAWFNGEWHKEHDLSFVKELDGNGCGNDHCYAIAEKAGRKEWWVHVRLKDGREGYLRVPY